MNAPDPLYVRARVALLDAVIALGVHSQSVILVGAQAIYMHTGDASIAVPEYTTDADFAVSPLELADEPPISDLLEANGFTRRNQPGGWISPDGIYVDLMVPEVLAGPGRRGADLGSHGRTVARRAKGLEGALVDFEIRRITGLDASDDRVVQLRVAGPSALLVAKLHKLAERVGADDRVRDKDALDILRLLQAIETQPLSDGLRRLLSAEVSASITAEAVALLPNLFGTSDSAGVRLALRAMGQAAEPDTAAASLVVLTNDLLAQLHDA